MSAGNVSVKKQLKLTLKKFNFNELETLVAPNFPELTWKQVKLNLIRTHQRFTVTNAIQCIEKELVENKVDKKVILERISVLQVIHLSRHSDRKTWRVYQLDEETEDMEIPSTREFLKRLNRRFQAKGIRANVQVTKHDGVFYLLVDERKSNNMPKRKTPWFYAVSTTLNYVFSLPNSGSKEILTALAEALGYVTFSTVRLSGKCIKSLEKLLRAKEQNALSGRRGIEPPVFTEALPRVDEYGIDFTQKRQRLEYAKNLFGEEPPKFELLVYIGQEKPWSDEEVREKLPDTKVSVAWQFKSKNIAKLMTTLIEKQTFTIPLPDYATKFLTQGENLIYNND